MKKATIIATVALLIAAGTYLAFAAEQMNTMMGKGMHGQGMMDSNNMMMQKGMMGKQGEDKGMMSSGMMGKGMMGGEMMGMCPMHMMMAQSMMHKQIVATEDGGVIVLAGNKLLKYDKDLNLVKEAELKIDAAQMQKKMEDMMKNCPMCQKMMNMDKDMGTMGQSGETEKQQTSMMGHTQHHND